MVYVGCDVSEEFEEELLKACALEERSKSSFMRIALRDRVHIIKQRYGVE